MPGGNERCLRVNVRAVDLLLYVYAAHLFRDILYMVTLQHVHGLCMSHSLWSEAAVTGELLLPLLRLYADQSQVLASVLVRSGLIVSHHLYLDPV